MERRDTAAAERLAWILDDLIRIPGTRRRIGLDGLIGLVPGGGDVATGLLGTYALVVATRLGAPPAVILRMAGNLLLDTVIGAIPLFGDLFDFAWKANRRNMVLLRKYMDAPARVEQRSRAVLVVTLVLLVSALVGMGIIAVRILSWIFGLLF